MGRVITSPGVLKNVQGQIDHALDLYQDIKDNNLKPLTITIDPVTNANGAYSHTTSDDRITEDMKAVTLEVGTPEVFFAPVAISTADGAVTLTCADAHGTSTVTVTFIHTWPIDGGEDVPASVTSTEFDILADRIGVLSNLETTDKSDIVHAVNEVIDNVGDVNSKLLPAQAESDLTPQEYPDGVTSRMTDSAVGTLPANSMILTSKGSQGHRSFQIAVEKNTNVIKFRSPVNNTTWGSWNELALNSKITNISKGRFIFDGVAVAVSEAEIRLFIPLANFDTNSTVTVHTLGVTNVWSDSTGASKITNISKTSGGILIRASESNTFTTAGAYFFTLDLSIS